MPLPVRVNRRAAAQIEAAASWWRINRPSAPHAIDEELERAFALLSLQPAIGARALNPRLRGVRRLYLSRVGYHLYYRVDAHGIAVLSLWHARRRNAPR